MKGLKSKGIISKENYKYLNAKDYKLGRFYLLLKIHKRLVDVPGQPAVSNCGTATEKLSEFVDFNLQPLVKMLPQVLKDMADFLLRLEALGDVPEGAILSSMDVVGLYPHIPHDEGLKSIEAIGKYCDKVSESLVVLVEELVDLAKIILENNYFEFDDNIYGQKLGTAIRTKFTPSFANIFMSQL